MKSYQTSISVLALALVACGGIVDPPGSTEDASATDAAPDGTSAPADALACTSLEGVACAIGDLDTCGPCPVARWLYTCGGVPPTLHLVQRDCNPVGHCVCAADASAE